MLYPAMPYLVYVCTNLRPEGSPKPSCVQRGATALLERLNAELVTQGLDSTVEVQTATCLGACENGCTMLVHTDNTWYGHLMPDDIPEIVESHFKNDKPVTRCFIKHLMLRRLTGS
ncbi:MAG: (2Fe-2S) ferredoxin domain-containing protein [Chloroherpetonaceae bacterium]|nr:(2Fe-2S) ferredoxin domain-containing protein [Chloroherpetonaceae bacterium]MDW8018928.1 (2Fe-2S) ferredoxin domain-containing protein [Chloroherpetonaceae bacterium]